MAITKPKTRINISVSKQTRDTLRALAKRDQMPVASKTADLVETALELEEDRVLSAIAEARLKGYHGPWISHEKVWGKIKRTR